MWSCMKSGSDLAGKFFDDVALHVHRGAVDPFRARLIEKRNDGELVDHFLKIFDAITPADW